MAAAGPGRYFLNANGGIIVREGHGPLPWLVTWLPNDYRPPESGVRAWNPDLPHLRMLASTSRRQPGDAAPGRHEGTEYLFCCEGCREIFATDPERYLAQIRDVVVCPACLAEKPVDVMVAVEYEGTIVHFCGCPGCVSAFRRDPERVLTRLEV